MLKKLIIIGGMLCNLSYASTPKISICKVIEHEAINSVVNGFRDYLKKKNINPNYKIETCQANAALASQIAAKFANSNNEIVIAIGTTPAQYMLKYAKEKKFKLIFSSVTNPQDISKSFYKTNSTGVSNFVDLKQQLELFKAIQPNLKKLGIIYNIGESNSIYIVNELEKRCKKFEIELVKQGIQKSSDIPQSINKLIKNSDAIFISNDNTALSGIDYIITVSTKNKIPVYVSDTDQVSKGCLAALGPNQYDIGVQTGQIVEKILSGKNINNIEIEYPKKTELFINMKSAQKLNIKIPKKIITKANKIILGDKK